MEGDEEYGTAPFINVLQEVFGSGGEEGGQLQLSAEEVVFAELGVSSLIRRPDECSICSVSLGWHRRKSASEPVPCRNYYAPALHALGNSMPYALAVCAAVPSALLQFLIRERLALQVWLHLKGQPDFPKEDKKGEAARQPTRASWQKQKLASTRVPWW